MSLEVANMSIVAHVVDGINHRALVAKSFGICLGIIKARKVLPSAFKAASANCAETCGGRKAKSLMGGKLHCVLPHVSLTLQK